jgi:hypothetical protein
MNQNNCVITKQEDTVTLCFQTVKEYQEYQEAVMPNPFEVLGIVLGLFLGISVIILGSFWFINKKLL